MYTLQMEELIVFHRLPKSGLGKTLNDKLAIQQDEVVAKFDVPIWRRRSARQIDLFGFAVGGVVLCWPFSPPCLS